MGHLSGIRRWVGCKMGGCLNTLLIGTPLKPSNQAFSSCTKTWRALCLSKMPPVSLEAWVMGWEGHVLVESLANLHVGSRATSPCFSICSKSRATEVIFNRQWSILWHMWRFWIKYLCMVILVRFDALMSQNPKRGVYSVNATAQMHHYEIKHALT